jgi:hypothetical protein
MALLPVEWPHKLQHLVEDLPLLEGQHGRSCSRIDVDVDADTLFVLNELEARARHRKVEIPLQDGSGCLTGEMNTVIGLGSPAKPSGHVARVRISFHDVEKGGCADA